jgi:ComF family protein
MARSARGAGAPWASSSGRSANVSARRSSRTSARDSCRRRRWPIRSAYRRARAVARFEDGPARKLAHRLKYSDRAELAAPIARWMARAGADVLADADLLVAVPLHPVKLWRRRFNQAAALAGEVARQTGKPCDVAALERVKLTRSQVGLSRAQRAENVQGAFRVRQGAAVRGCKVVLVDDVLTSGATANAASRALLRAGAADVDVLVFARVVTRG